VACVPTYPIFADLVTCVCPIFSGLVRYVCPTHSSIGKQGTMAEMEGHEKESKSGNNVQACMGILLKLIC